MHLVESSPDYSLAQEAIMGIVNQKFSEPVVENRGLYPNIKIAKVFGVERFHAITEYLSDEVEQNPDLVRWILSDRASRIEQADSFEDDIDRNEFDPEDTRRVKHGKHRVAFYFTKTEGWRIRLDDIRGHFNKYWKKMREIENREFMERYYGRDEINAMIEELGVQPSVGKVA